MANCNCNDSSSKVTADVSCCGKTITETNTTVTKYGMAACPSDLPAGLTYVGMRYIINFASPIQWSSEVPYEHLTAVQYEGFTYISKQAVPVGIPLDNEDYWLLWADPNSQMEELRQLVESYISQVENYDERILQNSENIESLSENIESLSENLSENITSLTRQLNTYYPYFLKPEHVGDFISREKFGCVCKNNDEFYMFTSNDYDNMGNIYIASTITNEISSPVTRKVGHANSCANDTIRERIWLAPYIEYTNGQPSGAYKLYWYNYSLNRTNEVETDFRAEGVSFDHVTKTLWAMENKSSQIAFYKMEESENSFTPAFEIEYPFSSNSELQDFAVYDDVAVISDTAQNGFTVDMRNNVIKNILTIGNEGTIWRYGEPEGLEFDELGTLYQARISPFGFTLPGDVNPVSMNSVTSLIVAPGERATRSVPIVPMRGVYVRPTTQAAFSNDRYQIKSANAIPWLIMKPSTIEYPDSVTEPYPVYIDNSSDTLIRVQDNATVNIPYIVVVKNKLVIYVTSLGNINFTDSTQQAAISSPGNRPANLAISNHGRLTYNQERFIQFGYNCGMIEYWYGGNLRTDKPEGVNINGKLYTNDRKLIIGDKSFTTE